MNAEIRVYPGMEMMAVDMAEVLHAALPESCVIQGCSLTLNGGSVHVASGRISIKGRLAYVEEGDVDAYTVSTTEQAHLCAICDLGLPTNPFQIRILSNSEYNSMYQSQQSAVRDKDGDVFNTSDDGIALLKMATVTISPGVGVSKITTIAAGKPRHSKNYIDEGDAKVQKNVDNLNSKETTHYKSLTAWRDHLLKRTHSKSKFKTWNIDIPHCVINAGQTKMFSSDILYGHVNTYSNGKFDRKNIYKNTKYVEKKDESHVRTSIKSFDSYGPQFLTPIGIVGIQVTNSDNGGKNRQRVRLLGWGFGSETCNVTLAMDEDTADKKYPQAIVDVQLKIQYVQEE